MIARHILGAAAFTVCTAMPARAAPEPAPVYFVIFQKIADQPRFDRYVAAVTPAIERRGGQLVAAGEPEVVEGRTDYRRVVVFIWPSREALTEFWHSEEYARIHKLREGAAEWMASIVPSIPIPEPTR